jgi:hypothetical protein
MANDPVRNALIYCGESEMAIYDYAGRRTTTIRVDKSTSSALKYHYELISTSPQGKLLFASTRRKQTNCFFILDASESQTYAGYENVVNSGVKGHKTWLTRKKKDRNPNFYRWTN